MQESPHDIVNARIREFEAVRDALPFDGSAVVTALARFIAAVNQLPLANPDKTHAQEYGGFIATRFVSAQEKAVLANEERYQRLFGSKATEWARAAEPAKDSAEEKPTDTGTLDMSGKKHA